MDKQVHYDVIMILHFLSYYDIIMMLTKFKEVFNNAVGWMS